VVAVGDPEQISASLASLDIGEITVTDPVDTLGR